MRNFVLFTIALVALGGGYYWYTNSMVIEPELSQDMPVPGSTVPEMIVTPPGTMEDGTIPDDATAPATKEFTVTNDGMSYTTKGLTVNKGDRVKITYQNTGGTHDFRIEGYNVGTKVIAAGASETFEFVADKSGTFEYYCSVGEHRANGMKGTLTVTN